MIALDTNVFVRYVTQDDPRQAAEANRLIERYDAVPGSLLLLNEVLAELVWVLSRSYGRSREEIAGLLTALTEADAVAFEDDDLARRAIHEYGRSTHDLADLLLLHKAKALERPLATFDKRLSKAFPEHARPPREL